MGDYFNGKQLVESDFKSVHQYPDITKDKLKGFKNQFNPQGKITVDGLYQWNVTNEDINDQRDYVKFFVPPGKIPAHGYITLTIHYYNNQTDPDIYSLVRLGKPPVTTNVPATSDPFKEYQKYPEYFPASQYVNDEFEPRSIAELQQYDWYIKNSNSINTYVIYDINEEDIVLESGLWFYCVSLRYSGIPVGASGDIAAYYQHSYQVDPKLYNDFYSKAQWRADGDPVSLTDTDPISVEPESVVVQKDGGTIDITVAGNVAWSAKSDSSWLTINSGSSGSGNGTINCTVAPNV